MTIRDILSLLDAKALSNNIDLNQPIQSACGSDMMSDVLAYIKKDAILLTGLCNMQVIRTAELLDIVCIIFVRGKTPTPEMLSYAEKIGINILGTDYTMFECCGRLYKEGLRGGGKVNE